MSQPYIKGPVCGTNNCPSKLYRIIDGRKICQFGHVLEGDIQINDEDFDSEFVVTRRLNFRINEADGRLMVKDKRQKINDNSRLVGNLGKEYYLKILQKILNIQLQEVTKVFDDDAFSKILTSAVKLNWIKLLEHYLLKDSVGSSSNDTFQVKSSTKLPNINDTILIIYYSIIQLNYYSFYFDDLIDLISNNRLPSIKTNHLFKHGELAKVPSEYAPSLIFYEFSENWLRLLAKFPDKIGIKMNFKINQYYPFILKHILLFKLPNTIELFLITIKITRNMKLSQVPELSIASAIIFLIKIYFTFLSPKVNYKLWLNHVSKTMYTSKQHNSFNFMNRNNFESIHDLIKWDDNRVENYLDYLQEFFYENDGNVMNDRLKLIFTPESGSSETNKLDSLDSLDETNHNDDNNDNEVNEHYNDENVSNDDKEEYPYFENIKKINIKDIFIIEDYLLQFYSKKYFISKSQMYKYYLNVENSIKCNLDS